MSETSWGDVQNFLRMHGWQRPELIPRIQIANAEKVVKEATKYALGLKGETMVEVPEMTAVAEWLTDNQRKGLLLIGMCGRGKSLMAMYVLPLILARYIGVITTVTSMSRAIRMTDEMLRKNYLVLDDVGVEQRYNDYGTERNTLDEIVDNAERHGYLLILTTNLTKKEMIEKYGERTMDRLNKITKTIVYEGNSFRTDEKGESLQSKIKRSRT